MAGAGPAGAIAARQLALSGWSVVMADGLTSGIDKIGETLPGAGIRLLKKLGLDGALTLQLAGQSPAGWPVGGTLVAWNDSRMFLSDALNDPYGQGLRLDRAPFDAALRSAATSAGACFEPVDVLRLERDAQSWHVGVDDGRVLHARWLVDATGRRARLARLIGERRWRGAPLVALYRTGRPEIHADLNRTIIVAGPDGWIYAGRLGDGRWVIGYHTTPRQAALLHAQPHCWNGLIAEHPNLTELLGQIALDPMVRVHDARSIGLARAIGERWVACGDAALAFDPIAGQGLFNAIYSGMHAASSIRGADNGASCAIYAAELARVTAIYAERRRSLYAQERRWCERPFWQMHREIEGFGAARMNKLVVGDCE